MSSHRMWSVVLLAVVFLGPFVFALITGRGLGDPVTATVEALVGCAIAGFGIDWLRKRRARRDSETASESEKERP